MISGRILLFFTFNIYLLHFANSLLEPRIPVINETVLREPLQRKINDLRAQNTDYQWLDDLNRLLNSVLETFDILQFMHKFAIKSSNGMRYYKHTVNNIQQFVPEPNQFRTFRQTLQKLYVATTIGMKYINEWFNGQLSNLMRHIAQLASYPNQFFQQQLLISHNTVVKVSIGNDYLLAMASDIKWEIYEEYVKQANKTFEKEQSGRTDLDKKLTSFNAIQLSLERGIDSMITEQTKFIKYLNELFEIKNSAPTSTNQFNIMIVSQTISNLGQKINKLQENPVASKTLLLLSNLRTFLIKIFDIYVISSDVHSNGEKLNISSTGFKRILEKLQNSIFMPYEHMVKNLKEPSVSKKQKVIEAISKASRNNVNAQNLAKKTNEDSREIRNSLVAIRLPDSTIKPWPTFKLDKLNNRIEKMGKLTEETVAKTTGILSFSSVQLVTAIYNSRDDQPAVAIREKLDFILDQNENINKVLETIYTIYSNPIYQLKQSTKVINGINLTIPSNYIIDATNTGRADVLNRIKEIFDSFGGTIAGIIIPFNEAYHNTEMWTKLNENQQLNEKVTKAFNDLNKIYKEIVVIFVELPNTKYDQNVAIAKTLVDDLDFVPESPSLYYIEINNRLESESFPNIRESCDKIRTALENIKKKTKEFATIEKHLIDDVFIAASHI